MDISTAKRYAVQYRVHIRRAIWVADVATPVAGQTNKKVTKWILYAGGLWLLRTASTGAVEVIENTHITADDLRAVDWTMMDAQGNGQTIPPVDVIVPPQPPDVITTTTTTTTTGSGGGGGSGGDGSGAGSAGGSGGSGSGSSGGGNMISDPPSGGGGGSSGGGNNNSKPPTKPNRTAPKTTLTVERGSPDACVALVGGLPPAGPITDSFTCTIALAADLNARAGEVWFYSLWAGGLNGGIKKNGTIVPGGNVVVSVAIDSFPVTAPTIQATCYLSRVGLQSQDSKFAQMRGFCGLEPLIVSWSCPNWPALTTEVQPTNSAFFTRPAGGAEEYPVGLSFSGSTDDITFDWWDEVGNYLGHSADLNFSNAGHVPYTVARSVLIRNKYGAAFGGFQLKIED